MPKRSRKPDRDPNVAAHQLMQFATGGAPAPVVEEPQKNPAAVALGRLGGLKGGKARAKALSKKQRADIAKRAALARWGKKRT